MCKTLDIITMDGTDGDLEEVFSAFKLATFANCK